MHREDGYWFQSAQFKIEPGEDALTNPGRYGKSLAEWLAAAFSTLGYDTSVIPEDWGWCVICARGDVLLWIGCGSVTREEALGTGTLPLADENTIVWHVFGVAEVPFFKLASLLKKWTGRLDVVGKKDMLNRQLHAVLKANSTITFCGAP